MKRTYVDSGVLIAAARGNPPDAMRAIRILDDPEREFVASAFVRLEVRPKAVYHRQQAEVEFYDDFFEAVAVWADSYVGIMADAEDEAQSYGLNAIDALHIAAAAAVGADELVTTEKLSRTIHHAKRVKVVCIFADDAGTPGADTTSAV